MNITIQISDATYAQLLKENKRIQGTIALATPTEGNFRAHNKTWRPKPIVQSMKLPHGRVNITTEEVNMKLRIPWISPFRPGEVIEHETPLAISYVKMMEELV